MSAFTILHWFETIGDIDSNSPDVFMGAAILEFHGTDRIIWVLLATSEPRPNLFVVDMEKVDLLGEIDAPVVSKQNLRQRIMALSLSSPSAREWLAKARDGIRPWGEFVMASKFQTPKSVAPLPKRVMKNIEHFQSNYLFVFMGLVVFCILTSPMLLVAIAACLGACYIISLKNRDSKLSIMGRELSVAQQYGMVGICSFPLFWLAGAGSAVFWVIGASFFVIMLHASFYTPNDEGEPFDVEMDPV